jgi:hypothetical protein
VPRDVACNLMHTVAGCGGGGRWRASKKRKYGQGSYTRLHLSECVVTQVQWLSLRLKWN